MQFKAPALDTFSLPCPLLLFVFFIYLANTCCVCCVSQSKIVHQQAVCPGGHVTVGESGKQDKERHLGWGVEQDGAAKSGWVVREAVSGTVT